MHIHHPLLLSKGMAYNAILPYITKKDILSKEIPSGHLYSTNIKQDKLEKKLTNPS